MLRWLLGCLLLTGILMDVHSQDVIPNPFNTIIFSHDAAVAFSPDTEKLIVAEPGTILLYDPSYAEPLLTLPLPTDSKVRFVEWHDDSSQVLVWTWNEIYLLEVQTAEIRQVSVLEDVSTVDFYQDTAIVGVVYGGMGLIYDTPEIYVWDATSFELMMHLPPADNCAEVIADDSFAAEIVRHLGGQINTTTQCHFGFNWNSAGNSYLSWVFYNNTSARPTRVYDGKTDELLYELRHCSVYDSDPVNCERMADLVDVRWSPDGTRIATASIVGSDGIKIWDAATGELLHTFYPPAIAPDGYDFIDRIVWNKSNQLAVLGVDGVYIWDTTTGEPVFDLTLLNKSFFFGLTWIHEEQLLFGWIEGMPGLQTTGGIWNAVTGEKLGLLVTPGGYIEEIIEGPDQRVLYIRTATTVEAFEMEFLLKVLNMVEE